MVRRHFGKNENRKGLPLFECRVSWNSVWENDERKDFPKFKSQHYSVGLERFVGLVRRGRCIVPKLFLVLMNHIIKIIVIVYNKLQHFLGFRILLCWYTLTKLDVVPFEFTYFYHKIKLYVPESIYFTIIW